MIQKEKLVQFYFSQYRDSAMALKKKNNDGKKTYEQRIGRLITEMQRTKTGKLTQPHLEEYHRQIRNMAYYALKQKNQYAIMQIRDILMPELVRLDIGTLREEEQELVTSRLLEYLRTERPGEICQHPMRSILKNFAENGIRSQIIDMVPTRPEMEFPRALEMKRHFILHVGPTNCGKTYQALQRLRTAYKGIYLGPLRLLALEVYEKMREGTMPFYIMFWSPDYYDINNQTAAFLPGVGDDGTAYGNRSKWERTPENEILWTLASQIQVETDEARRAELSEELQREYAKDNPLAFLLQHPKTFAYSTNTLEKVTYNDLCKIELCELTAK